VDVAFRVRVRDASDTTDERVWSTVPGQGEPFLEAPPTGDGTGFDPFGGQVEVGGYRFRVIDALVGGGQRSVTRWIDDAGGVSRVLGRRTFYDLAYGGGAWAPRVPGYLTQLTLAGALVYDGQVGESRRAELRAEAFAPRVVGRNGVDPGVNVPGVPVGDPVREPLRAFFARWPRRGALAGGPITAPAAAFGRRAWLGVHETETLEATVAAVLDGGLQVRCTVKDAHRRVATRGGPSLLTGATTDAPLVEVIRERTRVYYDERTEAQRDRFPELVAVVRRRQDPGSGWASAPRLHAITTPPTDVVQVTGAGTSRSARAPSVVDAQGHLYLAAGVLEAQRADAPGGVDLRTLAVGDVLDVSVVTRLPSADSPLYYTEHPCDLTALLWQDGGVDYDAASLTPLRGVIGDGVRLSGRVTSARPLAETLEQSVFLPFGVSVRPVTGGWEAFDARVARRAAPTLAVSTADLVDPGTPLDLNAAGAITRVELTAERYVTVDAEGAAALTGEDPADGVLVRRDVIQRTTGDDRRVTGKTLRVAVPGMVHAAGASALSVDARTFHVELADAFAREVSDRAGAGGRRGTVSVRVGTPAYAARLGDELLLGAAHHVNQNRRLQDAAEAGTPVPPRAAQVVRRTEHLGYAVLELVDSGGAAQAPAVTPSLSLAVVPGGLFGAYAATVTNAAALNAAGAGLTLRFATTTGAAPPPEGAGADWRVVPAGQVPTTPLPLPILTGGQYPWVQARAEAPGRRAGPWGPWTGTAGVGASAPVVALDPPGNVSAAAITGDGTRVVVTWAPGANAGGALTDVWLRRASEAFGTERRLFTLPAGSRQTAITDLVPGVGVVVLVSHRDPATNAETVRNGVPVTPTTDVAVFGAPLRPTAYVRGDGIAGLAVEAQIGPDGRALGVQFSVRSETAEGSDAYGPWTDSPVLVGAAGDWTRIEIGPDGVPNDGRRWQLRARHARGAQLEQVSDWTATATVRPWGPVVPLGSFGAGQGAARLVLTPDSSPTQTVVTARTEPPGGTVRLVTSTVAPSGGPAAGVDAPDGTTWTFPRAAYVGGAPGDDGTAEFRGTANGAEDADVVVIPAQGRDTVPLLARVRQLEAFDDRIVVRVSASAPYVNRDAEIVIAAANGTVVQDAPVGSRVGFTASQVDGYEDAIGGVVPRSFVDFTIPRPPAGAAPGRCIFRVEAAGCVPDLDVVDVAPQATAEGPVGPQGPPGASAPEGAFVTLTATVNYAQGVIALSYTLAPEWEGARVDLTARTYRPTPEIVAEYSNVQPAANYSPEYPMQSGGTRTVSVQLVFVAVIGSRTSAPYVRNVSYQRSNLD
jgi:hypothetical protein